MWSWIDVHWLISSKRWEDEPPARMCLARSTSLPPSPLRSAESPPPARCDLPLSALLPRIASRRHEGRRW